MEFQLYRRFLKRPLDFVLALVGIIVFSPVLIVVGVLVRIKLGSPVIFVQERPGKNEKIFKMYKFRTMTEEKDEDGNLLSDEVRLTRFGRMLRATSLDELPGLLNIIKGDMSIVGPRPLLVQYLPYYDQNEKIRHSVRPGLTGLSQVNGRNFLEWDKRLQMDIEYVDNISFENDLVIILLTARKVIIKDGIVSGNDHVLQNLDDERRVNIGNC